MHRTRTPGRSASTSHRHARKCEYTYHDQAEGQQSVTLHVTPPVTGRCPAISLPEPSFCAVTTNVAFASTTAERSTVVARGEPLGQLRRGCGFSNDGKASRSWGWAPRSTKGSGNPRASAEDMADTLDSWGTRIGKCEFGLAGRGGIGETVNGITRWWRRQDLVNVAFRRDTHAWSRNFATRAASR